MARRRGIQLGAGRAQSIDQFACLKDVDRRTIRPVAKQLPGVRDSVSFAVEVAGFFKRIQIGPINTKDKSAHGEIVA